MNILGPDSLIFGVDDVDACVKFGRDYGLAVAEASANGATLEAMDGTSLTIRRASDTSLAASEARTPNLRDMRYGVADAQTLQDIAAELTKDREVVQLPDGVIRSRDDDGYAISFQVTTRRPIQAPHYGINVPGQPAGRELNVLGASDEDRPQPRTLSHVVLFTRDKVKAEAFYNQRLGFRTVDEFTNLGPFMRPAGTQDHHTLFMIQAPLHGVQHFTFHMAGANELMKAGWEFQNKGYQGVWGPGRHIMGSNWFWYFKSPFGGEIEYDADMDQHDDSWVPRRVPASRDMSQIFLAKYTDKWFPGDASH